MKIHRTSNPDQMKAAFNARIAQLDSREDVVSSSTICSSTTYEDVDGVFGEPGERYTSDEIRSYWDNNYDSDPVLEGYSSFKEWFNDSKEFLKEVDDEVIEGGCHGRNTKSSETEIDDKLEEVTGEEDLMEELDSEYIDVDDEVAASIDINSIDTDKLDEVIDKYNGTSSPVSGDWETETADEQQTIADAFNISLDDAKEVMIKLLGFPEDDKFIGAATDIKAYSDFDDFGEYNEEGEWQMIDHKKVDDFDGFVTDYSLWYNPVTDQYVTIFGDNEFYTPENSDVDMEFDNEEEAHEWFDSYSTDTV